MSNTAVGPVYDTIISEVINAVRVDFEENGADDSALEDLKKVRPFSLSIPRRSRPRQNAASSSSGLFASFLLFWVRCSILQPLFEFIPKEL